MKNPYTGRCALRTRAKVPSKLSPNQLTTSPADESHSHLTSVPAIMNPKAHKTAPTTPMKVSMSEVTHAGILSAIHTNAFFSAALRSEVCIISEVSFPISVSFFGAQS